MFLDRTWKPLDDTTSIKEKDRQVCQLSEDNYYNRAEQTGSCYMFASFRVERYETARQYCWDQGGQLLFFKNEKERSVLLDLIHDEFGFDNRSLYYTGLEADYDRNWFTCSGVPLPELGYEAWSPGEPNNAGGAEDCAALWLLDCSYVDVACIEPLSFICKREVQSNLFKYA